MISVDRLIAAGLNPTAAKTFAPHLAAACDRYAITTPRRIGGFIGQLMIESGGFARLEENLFYTTPARIAAVWPSRFASAAAAAPFARNPQALANRVYAGKIGNGNESSGDGWRFRGRGLKQLTGRANYAEATARIGRNYVDRPDLVAQPADAALTAAWFFARHGCNDLADNALWDEITRAVNGPARLQAAQRRAASIKAERAFR